MRTALEKTQHDPRRYIYFQMRGRLGNILYILLAGEAMSQRLHKPVVFLCEDAKTYQYLQSLGLSYLFIYGWTIFSQPYALKSIQIFTEADFELKNDQMQWKSTLDPTKIWCFDGYWQPWPFHTNTAELKARLLQKFLAHLTPKEKALASALQAETAVAVHIRRTDYLAIRHLGVFGVCSHAYYVRALQYVMEKLGNIQLYIFSDDEAETQFLNAYKPTFVSSQTSGALADMTLMATARNLVMANSSFTAFSHILNPQARQILITPRPFYLFPILPHIPAEQVSLTLNSFNGQPFHDTYKLQQEKITVVVLGWGGKAPKTLLHLLAENPEIGKIIFVAGAESALLDLPIPQSICPNLPTALEACQTQLVGFWEAGDIWLPRKLKSQLAFLQTYQADYCLCQRRMQQKWLGQSTYHNRYNWSCLVAKKDFLLTFPSQLAGNPKLGIIRLLHQFFQVYNLAILPDILVNSRTQYSWSRPGLRRLWKKWLNEDGTVTPDENRKLLSLFQKGLEPKERRKNKEIFNNFIFPPLYISIKTNLKIRFWIKFVLRKIGLENRVRRLLGFNEI